MQVLHPRRAVACGAQRSCRAILTASHAVKIRPCHGTHHREARQGLYQKIPGSQMTTHRAMRRRLSRPPAIRLARGGSAKLTRWQIRGRKRLIPANPASCGQFTMQPGISTGHRHLIATTRNMQRAGTMWPGGFCLMTKQLLSPSSPESCIAVSLQLSML